MQSMNPPEPAGLRGRQLVLAVFTLQLGIAISVIDSTAITLLLPTVTRDLGVRANEAIWLVNGFQMAALVALLPLANWGDRVSYRRVYLGGAALWGVASGLAFMADSLAWLVTARVMQGLGAAGIMSVNMALVRQTWPPALLGRGVALNSMVVSTATVGGPLLAALVLSMASWRWLFALHLVACLLLLALGTRTLPRGRARTPGQAPSWLDVVFNAGLFVSLFLAADAFGRSIKAAAGRGLGLLQGALLLMAGLLVGLVHIRRQRRQATPLLPLDLLKIDLFRLSIMTSVGSFAAQAMAFIVLPFLLLEVWRTSASQAGWLLACWPAGTIVAAFFASRWIGRYHGGWLGAAGLTLLATGLVVLAYAALSHAALAWVAASLVVCGLGFGLFQSPNNHLIITVTPAHRTGAASGMIGTARLTGQTLGATCLAVLLAWSGQIHAEVLSAGLLLAALLALLAALSSGMRTRLPRS